VELALCFTTENGACHVARRSAPAVHRAPEVRPDEKPYTLAWRITWHSELNRFVEAMIAIRGEIDPRRSGVWPASCNT
jgi:hypothetical protein